MSKKILGLDLGTNSIGWALVDQDFQNRNGKILGLGSRIIPMSQDILGEFGRGNSVSQTAERTRYRSMRRLRERYLLRRERLHRVLNILGFLPKHYAAAIDFEQRLGKFKKETEPKIPYDHDGFIFKNSFEEMLDDFRERQPDLLVNKNGKPAIIPYDWTIYYLRKKALTHKIEKEELAWVLLNFNVKRGYFQLRNTEDEFEEDDTTQVLPLKVLSVTKGEKDKKFNKYWYTVELEQNYTYQATFYGDISHWAGTTRDFVIASETLKNGTIRHRISSLPTLDEIDALDKTAQNKLYGKIKIKTENEINKSAKTVGQYIYDALLENPKQKIRGKLVRTIDRRFYKDELKRIILRQKEFHPELQDQNLYNDCVRELYKNNDHHQLQLTNRDITHLLIEGIIFYQRPLRSQKSSISNCTLEVRKYKAKNGTIETQHIKVTPKSNPYYQEFRIWQWIHNLSIYKKDDDCNVTTEFLNTVEDYESLFEFLNDLKEVEQKHLMKYFLKRKGITGKALNAAMDTYRWNYVEDKGYPCNETRALLRTRFEKATGGADFDLTRDDEQHLWHIIYSINDKVDFEKALRTFSVGRGHDEKEFVNAFKTFPPFKNGYGSFSEKAIKKLLPLMRRGKYWDWNAIDSKSRERIQKILTGEYDENIKTKVREKTLHLTQEDHFQGLPLWLTQYVVYGRHSEPEATGKWTSINDLEEFLRDFKQHSLRNPIVEQVITETLRVVRDIWAKYGQGSKGFFDEIHLELGRELKKTKQEREVDTKQITANENTNLRIKALLVELQNDPTMENVRPYSPMQQEILKIYEQGVLQSNIEISDDILKISSTAQPSSTDLKKYKLWLEQKYRSPYTGDQIPLNRLFTEDYEIEHIIPQSLYFDDSQTNKVICESAVNKLKDNQLGYAFIKKHHGEIVQLGFGRTTRIFEVSEYEDFVKQHYAQNRGKRNKLLLEDIPEEMIERQLNDTRYISKYISGLLSNLVRADTNDDGVNSKNLVPTNGKITTTLKQDWGLNDVWNDLILPRFERMNRITNSTAFTAWNENHQKFLPTIPLELSKGFSKKRIDHRHHAMDALVIACATRDHVNLLNNESAKSETKRYDLQNKLRRKEPYFNEKLNRQRDAFKEFHKPWETFTQDARNCLEGVIVSFKQNLRVINKATNYYQRWNTKEGARELVEQKGVNWAIRKQLHKDTVSGKVNLNWIKVPKGKILSATRKSLNTDFDLKAINSITDTGIQKILRNYLVAKNNNPEIAFSPEGIEELNRNIEQYNDGIRHKPIYKVRVFELGSKFPLGEAGNKKKKYVEAAKGTNLFFGIYKDKSRKLIFETVPLNEVIERQKQGLSPVPDRKEKEWQYLFHLSPHDLVYVPSGGDSEKLDFKSPLPEKVRNIYKVVSFTGNQIFFVRHDVATSLVNKQEFSSLNKMQRAIDGTMIKEVCVKLDVDRLGNITGVTQNAGALE